MCARTFPNNTAPLTSWRLAMKSSHICSCEISGLKPLNPPCRGRRPSLPCPWPSQIPWSSSYRSWCPDPSVLGGRNRYLHPRTLPLDCVAANGHRPPPRQIGAGWQPWLFHWTLCGHRWSLDGTCAVPKSFTDRFGIGGKSENYVRFGSKLWDPPVFLTSRLVENGWKWDSNWLRPNLLANFPQIVCFSPLCKQLSTSAHSLPPPQRASRAVSIGREHARGNLLH